jgi:hypothetical protein
VGLLVRIVAEPTSGDNAVTIAFGGRPHTMARTVGHFANVLPVKIPLTDTLHSHKPTFDAFLRLVSTTVSTAKKHNRFSFPDLAHSLNASGLRTPQTQVAM